MSTTTTPVRRALDVIAQLIAAERERGGLDDHDRAILERNLATLRDQRPDLELIVCARLAAGREAVLFVHDSGDVILWPDAASAEGDDGTHARNRWNLDPGDAEALRPLADPTDADRFAAALGDDGQQWETDAGEPFEALAERMGAEPQCWRHHPDGTRERVPRWDATTSDAMRYVFPDGSAIVAHGDAWDHEGDQPGTWRG